MMVAAAAAVSFILILLCMIEADAAVVLF